MQDYRFASHDEDHPEELAAALLSNQGLDGAIRSCQAFGWEGVLDRLQPRNTGRVPDAE